MKRLRPFFSYYGSKWRLATKYPAFDCDTIIEPFAGSACYSLLHHQKKVCLYDLDENICAIWDYLINVSECEILSLPLLHHGQAIPQSLPFEAQCLLGFWVAKAATYPQKFMTKYKKSCGFWSESIRYRIASQLRFIRHWTINLQSYEQIKNCNAVWFVDPPYMIGGQRYRKSTINYHHLSQWCLHRQGHLIVCENNNAKWLPFEPFAMTKGMKKNSVEVLYTQTNIKGVS